MISRIPSSLLVIFCSLPSVHIRLPSFRMLASLLQLSAEMLKIRNFSCLQGTIGETRKLAGTLERWSLPNASTYLHATTKRTVPMCRWSQFKKIFITWHVSRRGLNCLAHIMGQLCTKPRLQQVRTLYAHGPFVQCSLSYLKSLQLA
jgi:hypothetical protein